MKIQSDTIETMDKKETARFTIDLIHRLIVHHGLWFSEAVHQFGRQKAHKLLFTVLERSYGIQMKRLSKVLGFEMEEDVPAPLMEMEEQTLNDLKDSIAVNWLVNDGIWFQAIEFERNMNDAKRCNDTCWARFSPVEAESAKNILGLSDRPGLKGLKKALEFRLYSCINKQTVEFEGDDSVVLYMNDCRVQSARKRKGLDDYPCKSGGLTEYTAFAETIDPDITTECIACPPDAHPDEWFCGWRFMLK